MRESECIEPGRRINACPALPFDVCNGVPRVTGGNVEIKRAKDQDDPKAVDLEGPVASRSG